MNKKRPINALYAVCLLMTTTVPGRAQLTDGHQVEVELKFVDDEGAPIIGANAVISFIGVVPNTGKTFELISQADGIVKAKSSLNGLVKAKVTKEGYYPVVWPQVITKGAWNGRDSFRAKIILREIKKPIPLYARIVELSVPSFDQWIGFDLQKGDWLKPWGLGVASDLEFFAGKKFNGYAYPEADFRGGINADVPEEELRLTYGKWTGELKLRVPDKGGGIHIEKEGYQVFSDGGEYHRYGHWEMRLPHLAPENGYQAEPLAWKKSYPFASPPEIDPKVGYYLRTRVKQDDKGNIISANYAKIMTSDAQFKGSDINFDPRGKISFSYYFNPTANERNLEFDPKKNLYPDLKNGKRVSLP